MEHTKEYLQRKEHFENRSSNEKHDHVKNKYFIKGYEQALNKLERICSANEAITLLKYYEEKCFTKVNGRLILVNNKDLHKYNTIKAWLDNKEKHYR